MLQIMTGHQNGADDNQSVPRAPISLPLVPSSAAGLPKRCGGRPVGWSAWLGVIVNTPTGTETSDLRGASEYRFFGLLERYGPTGSKLLL